MKIQSVTTHSAVNIDGRLTNFLSPNDLDFVFRDSWIIATSKRSGKTIAVPAANIPFMSVEMEEAPKAKAKKAEAE